MRFPGNRIPQHYFPRSTTSTRRLSNADVSALGKEYPIVGLDQLICDIEVQCDNNDVLERFGITPGESIVVDRDQYLEIEKFVREHNWPTSVHAGGAVGNTLSNFSLLSGERSYMLGTVPSTSKFNDLTWRYLADSHPLVSMERLTPVEGHLAHAYTFITPLERSFALDIGIANKYSADDVESQRSLIETASVVLLTAYCLRDDKEPIHGAALKLMEIAQENDVPVCLAMGTSSLISQHREKLIALLKDKVTIAAMNQQEAQALTGKSSSVDCIQRCLDWCDVVVVTEGAGGMTIGGYSDSNYVRPGASHEGNPDAEWFKNEYSRLFEKRRCKDPVRVFSHAHPYLGGPERISTTNGAGDSVLAAVLHDITANKYHKERLPHSEKHTSEGANALSYSSCSRISQYGNRVAYQVLLRASPRLDAPLDDDR